MADIDNQVTFRNKGTNAEIIAAGGVFAIEDQNNALKNNNIPHNTGFVANLSPVCTLFCFLDDMIDQTKPDYVIFPLQSMNITLADGVRWTTMFLKNTHASTGVAANEIKYNITTVKDTRKIKSGLA